eukprot:PLAT7091.6.p1 GENE.PLAT7091.6~~PLAT7091.6.p1  ORF type:complete len:976 (+),score=387.35 PLAT7091.6:116-2929(+)
MIFGNEAAHSGAAARTAPPFSPAVVKKLTRALSLLLQHLPLLSRWGLAFLVPHLIPFVRMAELSPSIFRHHFLGIVFKQPTLLVHLVLLLFRCFPAIFTPQDEETVVQRVTLLMRRGGSLPLRLLSVQWLLCFPSPHTPLPLLLYRHSAALYPLASDPLSLMRSKLLALLSCFHPARAHGRAPPAAIMHALDCLRDFRYRPPASPWVKVAFQFLLALLHRFPHLCVPVRDWLHATVCECPQFVPHVIDLIDDYVAAPLTAAAAGADADADAHMHSAAAASRLPDVSPPSSPLLLASPPATPRLPPLLPALHSPATPASLHVSDLSPVRNLHAAEEEKATDKAVVEGVRAEAEAAAAAAAEDGKERGEAGQPSDTQQVRRTVSTYLLASFGVMLQRLPPLQMAHYFALMERIVRESSINPNNILHCLLRFVTYAPSVCREGDWQRGHAILSVARLALLHHPAPLVFRSLSKLLLHLHCFYGDVDIRDRAYLFLQLLTHVSHAKLAAILTDEVAGGAVDSADGGIDLQRFMPVARQALFTVHPQRFLDMARSMEERRAAGLVDGASAAIHDGSMPPAPPPLLLRLASRPLSTVAAALLDSYLSQLVRPDTAWTIKLPFTLAYRAGEADERDDTADSGGSEDGASSDGSLATPPFPAELYSLVVELSQTPHFVPVPAIHLPYLTTPAMAAAAAAAPPHVFPFMYKLVLTMQPLHPMPASFDVRLVFSDAAGRTCEGALPRIHVLFQDLFLPVRPPAHPELSPACCLAVLFNQLWRRVTTPAFASQLQALGASADGEESTTLLHMPRAVVVQLLSQRLAPFLAPAIREEGKDDDEASGAEDGEESWYTPEVSGSEHVAPAAQVTTVRAVIFLPSHYHLLFKFRISPHSTLVRVRTDNWLLLSELDRYFDDWRAAAATIEEGAGAELPLAAPLARLVESWKE